MWLFLLWSFPETTYPFRDSFMSNTVLLWLLWHTCHVISDSLTLLKTHYISQSNFMSHYATDTITEKVWQLLVSLCLSNVFKSFFFVAPSDRSKPERDDVAWSNGSYRRKKMKPDYKRCGFLQRGKHHGKCVNVFFFFVFFKPNTSLSVFLPFVCKCLKLKDKT